MVSTCRSWWRRWSKGGTGDLSIVRELRDIACGLRPCRPGAALAGWLESVGWVGEQLSPQDAHSLLA
eukprot:12704122-Alexandrium_andersonii.AAC.1